MAMSTAAEASALAQQIQDNCALKFSAGLGFSTLCFHLSAFRETPELDVGMELCSLSRGRKRKAQPQPVMFYVTLPTITFHAPNSTPCTFSVL